MRLRVNPNRMELIRLKKRLSFAYRGHKLLKDKQEELMRYFLGIVREAETMRKDIGDRFDAVAVLYSGAQGNLPAHVLELMVSAYPETHLQVGMRNKMNVRLPEFTVQERAPGYQPYTEPGLNMAQSAFSGLFVMLLKLAEKEKAVERTAYELQRTRRRVNALEHILIPSLKDTIRFITNRLNELERENITRLLKVKEIVAG